MSIALRLTNVSYHDKIRQLTCAIQTGSRTLLQTSREDENSILCRLITGMSEPTSGEISVLDSKLAEMSSSRRVLLRHMIGLVPFKGGLVSNLKLWENIMLPQLYHAGRISEAEEEQAMSYLKLLNYSGNLMALPAHLSLYERRVAAFVRSVVSKARLMLYCNVFEGLSPHEQAAFAGAVKRYHGEQPESTCVYLGSLNDVPPLLECDQIIATKSQA